MRTWGYRIIDFGTHKALHEVHYAGGNPVAYTESPATFACDHDQNDIAGALDRALFDARKHPVLNLNQIGAGK